MQQHTSQSLHSTFCIHKYIQTFLPLLQSQQKLKGKVLVGVWSMTLLTPTDRLLCHLSVWESELATEGSWGEVLLLHHPNKYMHMYDKWLQPPQEEHSSARTTWKGSWGGGEMSGTFAATMGNKTQIWPSNTKWSLNCSWTRLLI